MRSRPVGRVAARRVYAGAAGGRKSPGHPQVRPPPPVHRLPPRGPGAGTDRPAWSGASRTRGRNTAGQAGCHAGWLWAAAGPARWAGVVAPGPATATAVPAVSGLGVARWTRRRPSWRGSRRRPARSPPGTAASTWRRRSVSRCWPPVGGRWPSPGRSPGKPVVSVDHAGGLRTTYEPVWPASARATGWCRGHPVGRVAAAPGHCRRPPACTGGFAVRAATYQDPLSLVGLLPVRLLPVWGTAQLAAEPVHRRPVRRPGGGRGPLRPPPTADR